MVQEEVLEDMEGGFVIIQGDDMLGKAVNVLEGLGWGRRSVCRSLSSATAIVPHRFPSKATLTLSLNAGHQKSVASASLEKQCHLKTATIAAIVEKLQQ